MSKTQKIEAIKKAVQTRAAKKELQAKEDAMQDMGKRKIGKEEKKEEKEETLVLSGDMVSIPLSIGHFEEEESSPVATDLLPRPTDKEDTDQPKPKKTVSEYRLAVRKEARKATRERRKEAKKAGTGATDLQLLVLSALREIGGGRAADVALAAGQNVFVVSGVLSSLVEAGKATSQRIKGKSFYDIADAGLTVAM